MTRATRPKPPRIAVTSAEAADSLGMAVNSFEQYVVPHVKVIRRGRLKLFAVTELQRWADESGEYTLDLGRI